MSMQALFCVPDDVVDEDYIEYDHIVGNYMSSDKEQAEETFKKEVREKTGTRGYIMTSRLEIMENSVGLGAMVVFIGMYLGIIFFDILCRDPGFKRAVRKCR